MKLNRNLLPLIMLSVLMVACDQAKKQEPTAGEKLGGFVEKTEKEASSIKASMEQKMEQGTSMMKEAGQEVEAAKDSMMGKLKELIEKAKNFLADGNYEEALSAAQSALAIDSNSQEAKDIIAQAKEKIQAMAGEKLNDLKTGIGDKFKGFGQ
ncbi:MAG: hypothetical protein H6755_03425 [Candidatus Omnitrophica bacterium]|nr:hypothetical protein [Candidatus Omnitrophota bacterium]